MSCKTVNLEQGMPTVDKAIRLLSQELASARANRAGYLKIIHGYGSSGKGGAIKREVRRFLGEKKREGKLREFVPGEEFSPFGEVCRRAMTTCPELTKDRDYSRGNDGITLVVF